MTKNLPAVIPQPKIQLRSPYGNKPFILPPIVIIAAACHPGFSDEQFMEFTKTAIGKHHEKT